MKTITMKSKDRIKPHVLVDDEDYERLSKYTWTYGTYASTRIRQPDGSYKNVQMHRMILDAPDGSQVDHINRLHYDNRRSNLRLCTPTENARNKSKVVDPYGRGTSQYVGVSKREGEKRWVATIQQQRLGTYKTEEEAAYVRDQAAMQLYGEFAYTNFNYEP